MPSPHRNRTRNSTTAPRDDEPSKNLVLLPVLAAADGLERGLAVLRQAHAYAAQLQCPPWDFAVEIHALREVGLTYSDLRCLVHAGLLDHGIETTRRQGRTRSFAPAHNLAFADRTCFVLTAHGLAFAQHLGAGPVGEVSVPLEGRVPHWDGQRRELRLGTLLIKQFKQPAPSQETILGAFEEESWPPRIDDPLPPRHQQDPKRHLHVTITNLNRYQKHHLLQFTGDGTGHGVCWQLLQRHASATAARE